MRLIAAHCGGLAPSEHGPSPGVGRQAKTYFIVSTELDGAGMPSHLAVVDTEGMSVLTAWSAGKFSGEKVAKALKDLGATERVGHKTVIIPGYADQYVSAFFRRRGHLAAFWAKNGEGMRTQCCPVVSVVDVGAVDASVAAQQDLPLPVPPSSATVNINGRCVLQAAGDQRVVLVAGLPVHHYSIHDAVAEAYSMVLLFDAGFATQKEIAVAFGCSERSVRRHQERYADGGMTALATRSGWRSGRRRIPRKRRCVIEKLSAEGVSNREIARRLGVNEKAIRKQVGPADRPAPEDSPRRAAPEPSHT